MEIVDAIKYGFQFLILLFGIFKKSPAAELRKTKAKLDQALLKAKKDGDLRELSKWFGEHI